MKLWIVGSLLIAVVGLVIFSDLTFANLPLR